MNCLGIDFGTTSVKSALYNEQLKLLQSTCEEYTLKAAGDLVELEAEKYWILLQNVLKEIQDPIDCLAIDTQCETLILCDEQGNPLRDAIVWLDNRATEEAAMIEAHFGKKKIYEITGQPEVTATWPACKLLWVKRNEPEIWAKTKKIFLLEDYLLYKLTGKFVTEKTLQSSTIYFDIQKECWWKEMLDYIGVEEGMLPSLMDSAKPVGEYNGIKVVTSAIDQIAGAIGAGVVKEGIISEMTGTTMVIYVPTKQMPPYREDSIVPCHYCYDGNYCLLSWSATAGMALKWFRDGFLAGKNFAEIDEMVKEIPIGSSGVTFLPYLCGSAMPKYNPDARGSFTGLTPEHNAAHFARAIMESIACMLKSNLDYLNVPVDEIRIMGGGAKSPVWCNMKANLVGKKLITLKNKETACLGSAILAGVGAGCFESVEKAAELIETDLEYIPDGADYSKVYEAFMAYDEILNVTEGK